MGKISNTGCEPRSDIVCIEGNGARPSHHGDGYKVGGGMYTLNSTEVHCVCYGISSYHSNAMLSGNPNSGIYQAETSRTLDNNGGNPSCNQGGVLVVEMRGSNSEAFFKHHTNRHKNKSMP